MPLTKDPAATLDYPFDWSPVLVEGESIVSHLVTVDEGDVVLDSTDASSTVIVAWLSGGTLGTTSIITRVRPFDVVADPRRPADCRRL
jgi:hypothetical protein